ncbi:MAG TPA: MBL fold metallo-hydrolase [Candidatus Acidoferrales bacterium]|nr:MBL fold metallo-hydrolase [Candidatus Acidoferrales bacterium]
MTRALTFVIIPWACPPFTGNVLVEPRRALQLGEIISLHVTILASGSSGNCTLLETENTRLLVDAGLGKKETLRRLATVGRAINRLDGIVISHEHSDHIGSLAQVLGQWRTTVYLAEATHIETLKILPETSHKRLDRVEHIRAGQRFIVGDIEVSPISIPHDAVDPLGFTFRTNGTKVAIVTDLGYLPELVKVHLRDSDCLVLESNHDLEMLKVGPYPWHVKQRVMSRTGHLSNHTVSEFLADAEGFDARARYVVLAHLSENNNNPDVARISAEEALGRRAGAAAFSGELIVASQSSPLPTLNF